MRLALLLLLALPLSAAAQPYAPTPAERDAIMEPILTLFDGMRAADSSAVRSAIHPKSRLLRVGTNREGVIGVHETPVDRFVAAMAGDHEVYDERLGDAQITVDGDLATVWVPYAFYLGDTFSHCGTNAFQLARLDGAWQIIHTVDTSRQDNCDPSIDD
jgi:hypothetical protein